ncbi:DUF1905 domain-containing protein [Cryobacterium arcticum]|uniref:DUF1905 domain-containing protein n=1 Tax=Cryobacterium arcticum TaxID=670052 RepID=A0A317ZSZ0_9MICO|nr:DUF1905 domain-containing protein [Cryobacterium arcticum]PXA68239.1 DUF1905 domain-containing protein [Cryobacterium arcticum]
MTELPQTLDHTFTALIGVDVKGQIWDCVEVPDSAELFGTKRSVRVDVAVDEVEIENLGLLVTGRGGHMISLNAKVRARLQKGIGDEVTVRLHRRLT